MSTSVSLVAETHADAFAGAMQVLARELLFGPRDDAAYTLNRGDPGLLRQLASLSADIASRQTRPGGSTIAAHADHVAYGLELLNRSLAGDDTVWATADWNASWERTTVSGDQWQMLLGRLSYAADELRSHLARSRCWDQAAAVNAVAGLAHLAYHLGAIRQILLSVTSGQLSIP
jgi:hypothetical protein